MALFSSAKVLTVGSFTAIGVGVGGAVAVSQKGNSEEKSRTQNLSPAKESVSASESTLQPSSEGTSISKSCSIVRINGPSVGQKITQEGTFDLNTLKMQNNIDNPVGFYDEVKGICEGTNSKKGVDSSNGKIVYVTYIGGKWNYSVSYQKDWESVGWIRG